MQLNPSQREAVMATEGYVRVLAGAGSGKTRALSHRFAYLVNELGIPPGNILCVTFTNKSANEMRRRIHRLTGDNDTGYINTFHGFCVSVLQEDIYAVRYPKSFLVLDNADIDEMLRIIYEERGLTLRDMTFASARDRIEIRKGVKEPDYYLYLINLSLQELYEKYQAAVQAEDVIFYGYLYQQKKCFGLDYNDLILFSLYIFSEHPDIRLKWQKRLEYIMIDEFQDIDALQYRLMETLCGYHGNLFIVGDPDQTVYTWRGANVNYLLHFDQAFPNVKTVMMMQNYRSTPQILRVANDLVSKNKNRIRKELIPALPDGDEVLCHRAPKEDDEARWITKRIQTMHEQGIPYGDIAILYRAHHVTRPIEEAFLQEKLPYVLYSGTPFFNRAEIKDALSYLRLLVYRDDLSFLRVANRPKRNLGKRRMQALQEYAGQHECTLYEALCTLADSEMFRSTKANALIAMLDRFASDYAERPVSEVLTALLNESGYEAMLRTEGAQERLDNLAELKQSVYDYETSCGEECTAEHYLAHVALFTNSDAIDAGEKVRLMTVHAAKGLEFPYVFLCGLNEGVFPSRNARTRQDMEEERRLAFVAITRAEKGLCLSEAGGRNFDGSPRYPSRFLLEIDRDLLTFTEKQDEVLLAEARAYAARAEELLEEGGEERFSEGTRVRHAVFGDGTVLDVDLTRAAYLVQFDLMETPRSISFRAKLEIIP